MLQEYQLSGRVALITGAGRGIGTGIAEALAEAGAEVVVNARTLEFVQPMARRLAKTTGRRVTPLIADVTDSGDASAMVEEATRIFGRVDILINNLGDSMQAPLVGPPDEVEPTSLSDEAVRHVLAVNVMAAIYCTRAVGPQMLRRRSGKIINISSFSALRGRANQTIYSIGKAGLLGFTRSLAREWAPFSVQVNAIAPGMFPDPITIGDDGYAAAVRDAQDRVPLGRVGQLREVGLLAAYLASSASDYMTGQVLCLDGGLTA